MCIRDRPYEDEQFRHLLGGDDSKVHNKLPSLQDDVLDAVSYTHLDVYKRQGVDITRLKFLVCGISGALAGLAGVLYAVTNSYLLSLIHI